MDNIVNSPMPFWDLFRTYLSLNCGHALTHPLYLKKGFAEAVKDVSSSIFMNSIDEIACYFTLSICSVFKNDPFYRNVLKYSLSKAPKEDEEQTITTHNAQLQLKTYKEELEQRKTGIFLFLQNAIYNKFMLFFCHFRCSTFHLHYLFRPPYS